MSGVFSIAPQASFVDELAAGLMERAGGDPLALSDMLVLLPTRRAARSLREAFLRIADGAPLLLPRMRPIGDVDEDDPAVGLALGEEDDGAEPLPPAIDPQTREALLMELVQAAGPALLAAEGEKGLPDLPPAQALLLAQALARLLDGLQIERVSPDALAGLAPEHLASHWQRTLDFLKIVGEAWPAVLKERDQLDPATRRDRALARLAQRWRDSPPAGPVFAAGSTGSQPATRELLAAIAGAPQGAVILPGVDLGLDEDDWAELDESHPQYLLRALLQALGTTRADVKPWRAAPAHGAKRAALLSRALLPAERTDRWFGAGKPPAEALDGVVRVDCPTPQSEALVVALAMREALEPVAGAATPRTAALVTPDRALARRVAAELRRWGLEVDDSAGVSLDATPPATLLRLVARGWAHGLPPVGLLSLLQHPLAALGLPRADLLDGARLLDRRLLRGASPGEGLGGYRTLIDSNEIEETAKRKEKGGAARYALWRSRRIQIEDVLARLDRALAPLAGLGSEATPAAWLDATIRAAEATADGGPGADDGARRLWRGEAGEALSRLLAQLRSALARLKPVDLSDWPALFDALIAGAAVRPRYGRHPRLAIWGPLEARLQRADRLILGGLNEGTWPGVADPGPWLSRTMQQALGLPTPERRIGQSAHDFAQAFAAPEVFLVRSEREGTSPTVPSRWLQRLDAVLGYEPGKSPDVPAYIGRGAEWLARALALDEPETETPGPRPRGEATLAQRPKRISASGLELLRRDPYGFYARYVLKLRALDALEPEPGGAERGQAIHTLLEEFLTDHPDVLPEDAEAKLLHRAEAGMREALPRAADRAFWRPRLRALCAWVVARERARRAAGTRTIAIEQQGAARFGKIEFTSRADRIDRRADGTWEILDYKTGRVPSQDEIAAGYAPQLLLEALIALAGGFDGAEAPKPGGVDLNYWRLTGRGEGGEEMLFGAKKKLSPVRDLIERERARLDKDLGSLADPAYAFEAIPYRRYAPAFNDYEHLERIAEWDRGGAGDTEDDA